MHSQLVAVAVLTALAVAVPAGAVHAEAVRIWPASGTVELGLPRACGLAERDELRAIVARIPLIIYRNGSMKLVTENYASRFYAKACSRNLGDVLAADGTTYHYSFWDENGGASTFVVKLATGGTRRRSVELIMIRRKHTPSPCYERWIGTAEVQ